MLGNGSVPAIFCNWLSQQTDSDQCQLQTAGEEELHASGARQARISKADLVVSFLPDELNQSVAADCLLLRKHFITPCRLNEKILNLRTQVESAGLLFLYELGFDPGIDHMSALDLITSIRGLGGKIISFHAHSGQLPAESNGNNPWQHRTGNPASIVQAGKLGAVYKDNGRLKELSYKEVFNGSRLVEIPGPGFLSWYPVTDSLGYIPLYGLDEAQTVVRSCLRHPDFMYGWNNVTDLNLGDDATMYDTNGMKLDEFFKSHFDKQGFHLWLEQKMMERFTQTRQILEKLMQFMEVQQEATQVGEEFPDNMMVVDEQGKLGNIDLDAVKDNAAAMVAYKMHEANLTLKQLFFLGMDDSQTLINKGTCSAAEVLSFAVEKKLAWQPGEHDMAVMLHEIEYELEGTRRIAGRHFLLKGNEAYGAVDLVTALCTAIVARQVLEDKIKLRGLHIPVQPEIYTPVMEALSLSINSLTPSVAGFSMVTRL